MSKFILITHYTFISFPFSIQKVHHAPTFWVVRSLHFLCTKELEVGTFAKYVYHSNPEAYVQMYNAIEIKEETQNEMDNLGKSRDESNNLF